MTNKMKGHFIQMQCALSTCRQLQTFTDLPVHWHFLLYMLCTEKASKITRMVVNAKVPLKKYTKTKEFALSVERQQT